MSLTTLAIYAALMGLGWFLRHRGVGAKDAGSSHPLISELEKLLAAKAEADRVVGQVQQKLGK